MTARLKLLEKWHSLCLLKGVDIVDHQYSMIYVNEIIDQLENLRRDDESVYRATLDGRRMGITALDVEWYMKLLDQREQEKLQAKHQQDEDTNPIVVRLREQNQVKELDRDQDRDHAAISMIYHPGRDQIRLSVEVERKYTWRHDPERWLVKYRWRDPSHARDTEILWNPRCSAIPCPNWFPEHWRGRKISQPRHMAYYVAWKFATGKGRSMGVTPKLGRASAGVQAVEDLASARAS